MSIFKEKFEKIKEVFSVKQPGNPYKNRGGFSQRDNAVRPSGSCNFTMAANALDCLGVDILPQFWERYSNLHQPEDILTEFSESPESLSRFKKQHSWFDPEKSESRPRHFSEHVAWIVNHCTGQKVAHWSERTFSQVTTALKSAQPVGIGGKFTSSGHFILLKGITPDNSYFYADDSWGDYFTSYRDRSTHNLFYLAASVKQLCWGSKAKHPTIIFKK